MRALETDDLEFVALSPLRSNIEGARRQCLPKRSGKLSDYYCRGLADGHSHYPCTQVLHMPKKHSKMELPSMRQRQQESALHVFLSELTFSSQGPGAHAGGGLRRGIEGGLRMHASEGLR